MELTPSSTDIFVVLVKIIQQETPNLFSSKIFKKANKHPNKDFLIKVKNKLLTVPDDYLNDVDWQISEVKKIRQELISLWNL